MKGVASVTRARDRIVSGMRGATGRAISRVRDFDPRENFIISSDPRGGSTWLSEIVSLVPGTAILWEPLNIGAVRQFRELGFGWRQHIPEGEDWPEAETRFRAVFSGRVLTGWTMTAASPRQMLAADRLAVKFCRANALLPWLTRRFDFRYRPVHLVRHPFAVVASQLAHGGWDQVFEGFRVPEGRFCGIWSEHRAFLESLETKAESLTAVWAITNDVPLSDERAGTDWITVHYEDLVLNPEQELGRIFRAWGLSMPEGARARARRASATTRTATFERGAEAQLSKWQRELSADQIDRMARVLEHFGVTRYGPDSVRPSPAGEAAS